jgi:hypothetical protein
VDRFRVIQGAALQIDVTLRDAGGTVITTYLGSETLAGVLWMGGGSASVATPFVAWILAGSGTIRATIADSDTEDLAPGNYTLSITLDEGTDAVEVYRAEVEIEAAAGSTVPGPELPATNNVATLPTVASIDRLASIYATDEQVYLEGPGDFGVIVPRSNRVARGTDGVFASTDLWTLTSISNDFGIQGVQPGMIVRLSGPGAVFATPEYMAVETVDDHEVTLRRPGLPAGIGQPPSPALGLTQVVFECLTLLPQIENAAFALNQQFSVDPNLAGRNPDNVYDQRVFRRLACLRVLYLQYMTLNRSKAGDFADKQAHYHDEFQSELASAVVRWGTAGVDQPPTTRFSARLSR